MNRPAPEIVSTYTHADSVIAPVICREVGLPRSTPSLIPSNSSAFVPSGLGTQIGPLDKVPVIPLPELSAVVSPAPSSNFQCPTKPGMGSLARVTTARPNTIAAVEVSTKDRKNEVVFI